MKACFARFAFLFSFVVGRVTLSLSHTQMHTQTYTCAQVPLKEAATKAGEMAGLSVGKAGTQPSYPFAKDLPAHFQLPPLA
jgi:hypothetical protein